MDKLIDKINSPDDLKALGEQDIPRLCDEIREFLVEMTEKNGGHLASNLGVVEMTVAIHRIFNSPKDRIIFDVGHQAYVHKMLTGRRDDFSSLRRPGGLSGFTSMRESEHDAFGAGHSSTALSAALGYAEADLLNKKDAYTVCVIGDGAYTGGMVHEALNNCRSDLPLIIILNENKMSISKNKGAFSKHIAKMRASKRYNSFKRGTSSVISRIPLLGKPIAKLLSFGKNKIRDVLYNENYFEQLGLYYTGPVDGNNYKEISDALREAKKLGKCIVIHAYTKKGKGYLPAEESPSEFHSVAASGASGETFHSVFADKLISLAQNDDKIVAVTAAMGAGTGLDNFGKIYPSRCFDVGIAEEHALTFSAGLAAAGMNPFVAIYSTFLQRGYDNILHDIALQGLGVKMIIDRAGLSLSDGATHHGIFDVSFLSAIPNVSILAPVTYGSLLLAVSDAAASGGAVAIRYSNAGECSRIVEEFYPDGDYENYGVRANFSIDNPPRYIFVTYGSIVERVLSARDILAERGVDVGVILIEKLKPYGEISEKLFHLLSRSSRVVFVEEGIKNGGAGMILRAELWEKFGFMPPEGFDISAIDDNFAAPSKPCDLYDFLGLSPERLADKF